jgi:hypothetical protein
MAASSAASWRWGGAWAVMGEAKRGLRADGATGADGASAIVPDVAAAAHGSSDRSAEARMQGRGCASCVLAAGRGSLFLIAEAPLFARARRRAASAGAGAALGGGGAERAGICTARHVGPAAGRRRRPALRGRRVQPAFVMAAPCNWNRWGPMVDARRGRYVRTVSETATRFKRKSRKMRKNRDGFAGGQCRPLAPQEESSCEARWLHWRTKSSPGTGGASIM